MKIPLLVRSRGPQLAGLAAVFLFLGLVARFWHPIFGFTAFYQLDAPNDELKISAFRELPVYVHRDTGGYDGLYYAQIAHDPTLRSPELPRAMDNFSYRARRILPPALAWLLGGGDPAWIIHTYSLINVIAWLALAVVLWRILRVADIRGWLLWAGVLFSAGALSSVRLALTDLTALTLIAAAMLAQESGYNRTGTAFLAASSLGRETALLAFAGKLTRPWFSARNVALALIVAAPLAAWLFYVRWRLGPADAGWANLTIPGAGLIGKWREVVSALSTVNDAPLVWTTLLATVGLTTQLVFIALRPRLDDSWWRIGAAYAVLLLFLGTAVWEGHPGAATRVLLPLQLAFNVLVHRTRAAFLWLILGNLSVLAGFLAIRDVPQDRNELTAQRLDGLVAVARLEDGWFNREHDKKHFWLWSRHEASVTIEALPHTQTDLTMTFGLRSVTPRTVVVRQGSRELWRGAIGPALTAHRVVVSMPAGRGKVTFTSDTPPVRENAGAGARELAFALYDVRLALPQP